MQVFPDLLVSYIWFKYDVCEVFKDFYTWNDKPSVIMKVGMHRYYDANDTD